MEERTGERERMIEKNVAAREVGPIHYFHNLNLR